MRRSAVRFAQRAGARRRLWREEEGGGQEMRQGEEGRKRAGEEVKCQRAGRNRAEVRRRVVTVVQKSEDCRRAVRGMWKR